MFGAEIKVTETGGFVEPAFEFDPEAVKRCARGARGNPHRFCVFNYDPAERLGDKVSVP
jgi:hypothetical protein